MGPQARSSLGWPVGQHGSFVQASVGLVRRLHRQKPTHCRSQSIPRARLLGLGPRAKSREVEKVDAVRSTATGLLCSGTCTRVRGPVLAGHISMRSGSALH